VILAVVLAGGYVQPNQVVAASAATGGGVAAFSVATALASAGASQLSLPWSQGETWRLTGGPHREEYGKGRPWSALDFQPKSGKRGRVTAARAGWVSRPCPNMVEVHHKDGWTTSYYHLRWIPVDAEQHVERGQVLGWTSKRSGCGGVATGPHLHFSVKRYKSFVNVDGMAIGGWLVREGRKQYLGCLVRNHTRECAPSGLVLNKGLVGAG
jgi:murein DD-endopeptidase MepM/ murein hydrolase activator NlpD